jgi:hypothetical protein
MGPEFEVVATAAGLHARHLAPDLTPQQLATAAAAIHRVTVPETLAAWAAAEVQGQLCPRCHACGRPLLDPASLAQGFGPECWGRLVESIKGHAALAATA